MRAGQVDAVVVRAPPEAEPRGDRGLRVHRVRQALGIGRNPSPGTEGADALDDGLSEHLRSFRRRMHPVRADQSGVGLHPGCPIRHAHVVGVRLDQRVDRRRRPHLLPGHGHHHQPRVADGILDPVEQPLVVGAVGTQGEDDDLALVLAREDRLTLRGLPAHRSVDLHARQCVLQVIPRPHRQRVADDQDVLALRWHLSTATETGDALLLAPTEHRDEQHDKQNQGQDPGPHLLHRDGPSSPASRAASCARSLRISA